MLRCSHKVGPLRGQSPPGSAANTGNKDGEAQSNKPGHLGLDDRAGSGCALCKRRELLRKIGGGHADASLKTEGTAEIQGEPVSGNGQVSRGRSWREAHRIPHT